MKNFVFTAVLALCFTSVSAFAEFQFVDCARIESPERVIINIDAGEKTGTFFASAGITDDPEPRTEVLKLSVVKMDDQVTTFEAQDDQSVFEVRFPNVELRKSSTGFAMEIGSRLKSGTYVSSNTFACFSVLRQQ